MRPSNEQLANVYQSHVPQLIVVWPLVWWHDIDGDWILRHEMQDNERAWVVREGPAPRPNLGEVMSQNKVTADNSELFIKYVAAVWDSIFGPYCERLA